MGKIVDTWARSWTKSWEATLRRWQLGMRRNFSRNPLVFGTVLLSFAWNILLLVGVILNLEFSHTRAAGGQFTDFPTAIRVLYVVLLALVAYQVWVFRVIYYSRPIKVKWLPMFFVIIGIFGILLNAASRSSDERWNVVPAAIITWAFWYYGVKREKSGL